MSSRLCRLVLALLAFAAPAAAAEYKSEYKLSTVLPETFAWGQGGKRWAELIAEKTQGRITVRMYPGASLVGGDQTREFTALRQGIIDLAVGSTINWSPQVPELNLFALPFLLPDLAAVDALTQGPVGARLFAAVAARDVVPLAWGENGFRELSNSKRPLRVPADLQGLKIRVVGSPVYVETMQALGAVPVQLSWADAPPAMAAGAVDGQENPLSLFRSARLHTVSQKHLTLWGYTADPLVFAVNKRVWDGWTEADRAAVRDAAVQAAAEEVRLARGNGAGNEAVLKEIEASGVNVVRLSPADRKAFQQATRAVYDKWTGIVGPELVREAEKAAAR